MNRTRSWQAAGGPAARARAPRRGPGGVCGLDPMAGDEGGTEAQRLAAIVEAAPEAVVASDPEGRITYANAAAERLYGYARGQLPGHPLSVIVAPEAATDLEGLLAQACRGEVVAATVLRCRTRQGAPVEAEMSLCPITDAAGVVAGVAAVARQRRPGWAAAAPSGDEADTASGQAPGEGAGATPDAPDAPGDAPDAPGAEAAETLSRRFLADAAHQLATPITGLQACAETLLRGVAEEDQRNLVARMVREAARAGEVLRCLLRMAELDEGGPPPAGTCDLVAVCVDEADRIWALVPELDVALVSEHPPATTLPFDPDVIREIVANLLDNARRHARETIEVTVEAADEHVEVRVADDGPGIPPEQREEVFERFVSLDARGGSGLGLAIGRALARAYGGDLRYDGGGFVLRLPTRRPAAGDAGDTDTAEDADERGA